MLFVGLVRMIYLYVYILVGGKSSERILNSNLFTTRHTSRINKLLWPSNLICSYGTFKSNRFYIVRMSAAFLVVSQSCKVITLFRTSPFMYNLVYPIKCLAYSMKRWTVCSFKLIWLITLTLLSTYLFFTFELKLKY